MIVGGVVAALLGAVVLALGAQFQNRGVRSAAATTRSSPGSVQAVIPVLVLLVAVLLVVGGGWLVGRKRLPPLAFALGGGVCFGFVATLMKIVLDRGADSLKHGGLIG